MINLYPAAGFLSEICNIQFHGGVTNTSVNYWGTIAVYGTAGSSWRIDHNIFNVLYAKNICTYGNSFSVIDHNTFYEIGISIEDNGYIPNDPEGDASWSSPPTYGLNSSNVLYVENNYFTNTTTYLGSVGATDGEGGGRIVFRYNTVMNDCFNNHGTESGGRLRSERSFEIYGNTFTCPSTATAMYPIYAACMIRGGSGVIFSNTVSGYDALAAIRNFRYTCSYYGEWAPFAGADGLSLYDSNDPTLYLTGTNSSPNGSYYLQANRANWTPNQWYGYSVLDTNSGVFSLVTSNTANTIYYIGTGSSASIVPCTVLTFNYNDVFQIRRVYAALDQPGRGSGDLFQDEGVSQVTGILVTINTALGIAAWPREALDGIYSWGNTVAVNGASADGTLFSLYPTIQVGRDLFNDTPKPGYTPYTYPHPLTFASVVGTNSLPTGTNGSPPGTNNTPTNSLAPPSGLHQIP
jgi:hypothetical protein